MRPLLNCGLWVPTIGPWCDDTVFGADDGTDAYYDPAGADEILDRSRLGEERRGLLGQGRRGAEIRWMVNSGNTRRESAQALMIPEMQAAGFNVVADNCDAACLFQQRLPALDYDLAMYINTARARPHGHGHHALRFRPDRGQQRPGSELRRLVQRGGLGVDDRVRPDARRGARGPT